MKAARAIRLPSYLEPRKLPVFRTVWASYWLVASNPVALCRAVAVPLALMLPLLAVATWFVAPWLPDPNVKKATLTLANELANWSLTLIQTPFLAAMAVAWHRFVLWEETPDLRLRFTAAVWKYAGLCLMFHLAVSIPMMLATLPGSPKLSLVGLMGPVMFFFILPRVSATLPAAAIDVNLPLDEAWQATRSNTLRLSFASLMCTVLPLLLVVLVIGPLDRSTPAAMILAQLTWAGVGALIAIVAVTFLSLTYRHFIRREQLQWLRAYGQPAFTSAEERRGRP